VAAADIDANAPAGPNGRPRMLPGSLKLLFIDPPAMQIESARVALPKESAK
jgi:hypothetical protein